ncbi:MAG: polyprenyl synthetase family protein [Lachnospiraceae bacterium]|nr:polyprenyl synthetase family protein [Lachnospiraceae bacterium]
MEIQTHVNEVEKIVLSYMPPEEGYARTVLSAMNYTMTAGGKRLRPMLMLETYRLFGGDQRIVEPFMAAIEMIHTYSLIHDDLPALDNDDYRRGRKTAHIVYGEDMAILAGDALLNYAYETAAKAFDLLSDRDNNAPDPKQEDTDHIRRMEQVIKAYTILARKPGIYGMIGGQTADVELTGKQLTEEELNYIYENKTGALIEASMMIGAILAGAKEEQAAAVEKLAGIVGYAFQIQDDILDIEGSAEELGKPLHSDEENGKVTYVTIHGLDKAKQDVARMTEEAVEILDTLPGNNQFLRELILSLISRSK